MERYSQKSIDDVLSQLENLLGTDKKRGETEPPKIINEPSLEPNPSLPMFPPVQQPDPLEPSVPLNPTDTDLLTQIDHLNKLTFKDATMQDVKRDILVKSIVKPLSVGLVRSDEAALGFWKGFFSWAGFAPQVEEGFDAWDRKISEMADVLGVERSPLVKGASQLAGDFYSISKLFTGLKMARAWAATRPEQWLKALGNPKLFGKAFQVGTLGAMYEAGQEKGEHRDVTPYGFLGSMALWGGIEAAGPAIPILYTKAREKAFRNIVTHLEEWAKKIPTKQFFQGKFGDNLLEWLQPASVRTARKYPEFHEAVTDYAIKEQKAIKEGQTLHQLLTERILSKEDAEIAGHLAEISPKSQEWKEIVSKLPEDRKKNILAAVAMHRKRWIKAGALAAETPFKEVKVKGAWHFIETPLEKYKQPEVSLETLKKEAVKGKRPFAIFLGTEKDEAGKTILNFSVPKKPGSEETIVKKITSKGQYTNLTKKYKILNKEELKAAGKWERETKTKVLSLLQKETYQKNLDKYLPRIYKYGFDDLAEDLKNKFASWANEVNPMAKRNLAKLISGDISRFLKRHNLPDELIEALEPIRDIVTVDAMTYGQTLRSIHAYRLLATVRNMKSVCATTEELKKAIKAGETSKSEWLKVPNDVNRYGMLANKYLKRDAFLELESMVLPSTEPYGWSRRLLSLWKAYMVLPSPRTQSRNVITNIILNHLVGKHAMSIFDNKTWTAYREVAKAMLNPKKNAKLIEEFENQGLFRGNFRQADLVHISPFAEDAEEGFLKKMKKVHDIGLAKSARVYEAAEQWAKASKYYYETRYLKVPAKEAAEDAMKATFNYKDLPPFIRHVRDAPWGAPFITFSYKALPTLAESAFIHPWRIGSLIAGGVIAKEQALKSLNLTQEDWEQFKKDLPDYVLKGAYMPLPWRDKKGRIQLIDMTYLVPWGDLFEARQQWAVPSGKFPVLGRWVFANPLYSMVTELVSNSDFAGRPIVNSYDDPEVKIGKWLSHIWQGAVPGLMIGGYDFRRIYDAFAHSDDPYTWTYGQALANELGLKTFSRTEAQARIEAVKRRRWTRAEITREFNRDIKKETNPRKRDKLIENYRKKLQELYKTD
ncbi:MAG: hypothetical protein J7K15_12215 [Deltaproteobacteria bacterium]|nr:hypothetical protein [Deltaproteobacteria bacterium]